jgi:hypothetical protein
MFNWTSPDLPIVIKLPTKIYWGVTGPLIIIFFIGVICMKALTTSDLPEGIATSNYSSFSGDHTAQGKDIIEQDQRDRHEEINGKNGSTKKETNATAVETLSPRRSQGESHAGNIV